MSPAALFGVRARTWPGEAGSVTTPDGYDRPRMQALGIHHLGVAVADLDEAVETYRRLFGASLEHRAELPGQGVEAAAVLVGENRVELIAPSADDTPVGIFLAGRG